MATKFSALEEFNRTSAAEISALKDADCAFALTDMRQQIDRLKHQNRALARAFGVPAALLLPDEQERDRKSVV